MGKTQSAELTDMQVAFVEHYLLTLSAKKSAIAAGYAVDNADTQGYQLLQNPSVSRELRRRMARRAKKLDLTAENVLREIARVAFSDVRSVVEFKGDTVSMKDSDALHSDAAACIQSISATSKTRSFKGESETTVDVKVKLHDKMKALDLAGKHLGLFLSGEGDDPFKKMTIEQLLALVKTQMGEK